MERSKPASTVKKTTTTTKPFAGFNPAVIDSQGTYKYI